MKKAETAIALLNSMIFGGEQHSDRSRQAVEDGFAELAATQEEREDLIHERDKLKGLLEAAKCPSCDGSGAIGHETMYYRYDDDGEAHAIQDVEWEQCQWCDERKNLVTHYQKGEEG